MCQILWRALRMQPWKDEQDPPEVFPGSVVRKKGACCTQTNVQRRQGLNRRGYPSDFHQRSGVVTTGGRARGFAAGVSAGTRVREQPLHLGSGLSPYRPGRKAACRQGEGETGPRVVLPLPPTRAG